MPNDPWPKYYVNISVQVLRDDSLPPAAFKFYCQLRALAKGAPSLTMLLDDLYPVAGLSRTRVYEYARTLRVHGALLWRSADNSFECSFPLESRNPGLRDSPLIGSSINSSVIKETPIKAESRNPGKRDDALLLNTIFLGGVLESQLLRCYQSRNQKPPSRFKTVQQKDAFEKVARALNNDFESLIETAIARDRYSLSALLAFLEACVKNRKTPIAAAASKAAPGFRLPDGV